MDLHIFHRVSVLCLFAVIVALSAVSSAGAAANTGPGLPTAISKPGEPAVNSFGIERFTKNPSGKHPYFVCPPPTKWRASCQAVAVPSGVVATARRRKALGQAGNGVTPALEGSGEAGGFSPADLRSAYNIAATGGKGATVAIVTAYGYAAAETDLKTYRSHYGLPECTHANGCFTKVNQTGEEGNFVNGGLDSIGWQVETALDMDMVSAACPECKILLVEANSPNLANLGSAENTAAKLGATVINNSWGGIERSSETEEDSLYYSHPGIPMFFSSGDSGYGVSYPSTSPNVVSVGGTSLHKDKSARGWQESAWWGAGSGCSRYEEKPAWQTASGCGKNRGDSDVAAVADPNTPVSIYSSSAAPAWLVVGGTSVSSPLVAAIDAKATESERAKGAQLFYEKGAEGKLFDVADGTNGPCSPMPEYLCTGKGGYDGPTGWGTPGASRPGAPAAGTYPASDTDTTKATLHGVLNPNGASTSYYFEFGLTTAYGGVTDEEESYGSLTEPIDVKSDLGGLTQGSTYHYRLVAKNKYGTTYGRDEPVVASRWSPQKNTSEVLAAVPWRISCPTATACVTAGERTAFYERPAYKEELEKEPGGLVGSQFAAAALPFGEHWDGSAWAVSNPSWPNEVGQDMESSFDDVSCASSTFCMAVGEQESSGDEESLIERWSGTEWSVEKAARPSGSVTFTRLTHVSCVSSTFCMAIGYYSSGGVVQRLFETWNGTEWKVISGPSESFFLGDVSCSSASSCVIIGQEGVAARIMAWNGSGWSLKFSHNYGSGLSLASVSCPTSASCMVVGQSGWSPQVPDGKPLALQWNGQEWGESSPPVTLSGVSCPVANWCIGVGVQGGHETVEKQWIPYEAVAARWNGAGWLSEPPPSPGYAFENALWDVSCQSTFCIATGSGMSPFGIYPQTEMLKLDATNLTKPTVNGTPYQGVKVSSGTGSWSGEVTGYTYQWQRCNVEGKECANIAGATSSEYAPVEADVGHDLVVKVAATTASGGTSAQVASAASQPVVKMGQVTEYSLPVGSVPNGIGSTPSGPSWYTLANSKIGKISGTGSKIEYSLPTGVEPNGITAGPDSNYWFTAEKSGAGRIGKISSTGSVTEYLLPAERRPSGIVAGPDGKLWFSEWGGNGKIGKITTSGSITEYALPAGSSSYEIAQGPDGNLWFTNSGLGKIGKVTTAGTITEYKLPSESTPYGIVAGPDGNLWFADGKRSKIGKITTGGSITEYALPAGSEPWGVAVGADGALWFAERGRDKIGRITTGGSITEYALPSGSKPSRIAAGPENRLWFITASKIGSITS